MEVDAIQVEETRDLDVVTMEELVARFSAICRVADDMNEEKEDIGPAPHLYPGGNDIESRASPRRIAESSPFTPSWTSQPSTFGMTLHPPMQLSWTIEGLPGLGPVLPMTNSSNPADFSAVREEDSGQLCGLKEPTLSDEKNCDGGRDSLLQRLDWAQGSLRTAVEEGTDYHFSQHGAGVSNYSFSPCQESNHDDIEVGEQAPSSSSEQSRIIPNHNEVFDYENQLSPLYTTGLAERKDSFSRVDRVSPHPNNNQSMNQGQCGFVRQQVLRYDQVTNCSVHTVGDNEPPPKAGQALKVKRHNSRISTCDHAGWRSYAEVANPRRPTFVSPTTHSTLNEALDPEVEALKEFLIGRPGTFRKSYSSTNNTCCGDQLPAQLTTLSPLCSLSAVGRVKNEAKTSLVAEEMGTLRRTPMFVADSICVAGRSRHDTKCAFAKSDIDMVRRPYGNEEMVSQLKQPAIQPGHSGEKIVKNKKETTMTMTAKRLYQQSTNKMSFWKICTDVCVVIDCRPSMQKFIPPLKSSLALLWQYLNSPTSELRIGCVTTASGRLDFTSEEKKFLEFVDSLSVDHSIEEEKDSLKGLPLLKQMDWHRGAKHHVFLLSNLAAHIDSGEDNGRKAETSIKNISSITRYIPRRASIAISTTLDGTDLLLRGLRERRIECNEFPLLDARKMALLVVKDEKTMFLSRLSSLQAKEATVQFTFDQPYSSRELWCPVTPSKKSVTEISQHLPPVVVSVQEVKGKPLKPNCSRSIWMSRDEEPLRSTLETSIYRASLGFNARSFMEDVILKCCKLDVIRGISDLASHRICMSRVWFNAVARFLAKEYNKNHRPEHCLKVRFVKGSMIEQELENGCKRIFYAEQCIPSTGMNYIEYCSKGGDWNNSFVDESLVRFAQTSFKLSGGDFIVAGLAGVRCTDAFWLTDPVILSRNVGSAVQRDCAKEYIKKCRTEAKAIMEKHEWNKKADRTKTKSAQSEPREASGFLGFKIW